MRGSKLVLVKWRGDVVAAHTLAKGERVDALNVPAGLDEPASDGVSLEVLDVSGERGSLPRAGLDIVAVLGLAASVGVHLGIAALVLGATALLSGGARASADSTELQAATVRDYMMRIAENEGAPQAATPQDLQTAAPAPPPEPPSTTPPVEPAASPDGTPTPPADPAAAPDTEQAAKETPPPKRGVENGSTGHDREMRSAAVCVTANVPANDGPKCTRTIVAESIGTQPGCFVDTVVKTGQAGTLTYPCSGDGEATVTFSGKTFHGAVIGGRLDACTGTSYPWSDGCTWNSAQRVTGSIASGNLRFGYAEAPDVKEHEQWCASACTASGRLQIRPAGSDTPPSSGVITL